jgi:hypothetical protein
VYPLSFPLLLLITSVLSRWRVVSLPIHTLVEMLARFRCSIRVCRPRACSCSPFLDRALVGILLIICFPSTLRLSSPPHPQPPRPRVSTAALIRWLNLHASFVQLASWVRRILLTMSVNCSPSKKSLLSWVNSPHSHPESLCPRSTVQFPRSSPSSGQNHTPSPSCAARPRSPLP